MNMSLMKKQELIDHAEHLQVDLDKKSHQIQGLINESRELTEALLGFIEIAKSSQGLSGMSGFERDLNWDVVLSNFLGGFSDSDESALKQMNRFKTIKRLGYGVGQKGLF